MSPLANMLASMVMAALIALFAAVLVGALV